MYKIYAQPIQFEYSMAAIVGVNYVVQFATEHNNTSVDGLVWTTFETTPLIQDKDQIAIIVAVSQDESSLQDLTDKINAMLETSIDEDTQQTDWNKLSESLKAIL
ncbi:hypothetical protein D3C78_20030 [compost metagenome]